jgi:hypothetical protein
VARQLNEAVTGLWVQVSVVVVIASYFLRGHSLIAEGSSRYVSFCSRSEASSTITKNGKSTDRAQKDKFGTEMLNKKKFANLPVYR